jgi:hypothetical protein
MSRLNKLSYRSLSIISPKVPLRAVKTGGVGYLVSHHLIIVACCAAVIALFVGILRHSRRTTTDQGQERFSTQDSGHQDSTFKAGLVLDGKTEDGIRFSNQLYKSSDCLKIIKTIKLFNSPAQAYEEFQREFKRASTIIDRGPKIDDNGQQVGERVVLQFAAEGQSQARAEVIWTKNSEFHSITAHSVQHALEFEQWLRLPDKSAQNVSGQNSANRTMTFHATQAFDGKTKEGFVFFERQFQTSDCEKVSTRVEYFGSPARASEELQKNLKRAFDIVEQGPKLDSAGRQVGERAVAVVASDLTEEHLDLTVVMWTENSELHSITAPSLQHVLEFEKRFYR